MAPSRDEDLDWLYGRSRSASDPEPTRLLPPYGPDGDDAGPARASPVGASRSGPPTAAFDRVPSAPPPGYARQSPYPAGAPVPAGGSRAGRRRPGRTAFRVLAILLVLAIGWLIAVPAYAWGLVSRVDDAPSGQRPANQPGQTFVIVGSDSRAGLSKAQQHKLGTGSVGGQRTDTIMLLYVPPGGKPALISVPRDSYVPIPGHGKNKINSAYAFGGPKLLVQTIESDTGLRVDGYLEIGFGGFVSIIDALNGIRMCLPNAIKDRDSHLNLPKGCQTLTGTEALGYVRMRKADPRGDLGRVERQRQMLAAVAAKAASPASVLNPVRYWTLCTSSARAVKLGRETSLWQALVLGWAMRRIAGGGGSTLTVPVADTSAYTPVGSAVLWDDSRAKAMFAELARGDTSKLAKYAK